MDIDAFVAAHSAAWRRLEHLVERAGQPSRCSGAELDELVDLYQRTATHLSVVRTASPSPVLVDRLSGLVASARAVVTGSRTRNWTELSRFVTVTFPAAVWRARWWAVGAAVAFAVVGTAFGAWVASDPQVLREVVAPEEVRQLVEHDFEDYYSSAPAASFGARVFVNNATVAALAFALGPLFVLPTVFVLWQNAVNIGLVGGLMAAHGRLDLFFGLILPHGLLELTSIFIAGGVGLRIGWTMIDPGDRLRSEAIAEEGRSSVAVVLGLVAAFAVAGFLEAVVTPSGLPTWARVGVGAAVEVAFLTYVVVLGRRAAAAGETGDLVSAIRGDVAPRS